MENIFMRRFGKIAVSLLVAMTLMTGCGGASDSKDIMVVSREEGSGTRGAFVELFGIEEKDANGNKVDHTTTDANIAGKTNIMLTTVAGEKNAIGYVSLGSLDDTVKAVKIDGVEPTVENVKSGSYAIARPFNIATKAEVSEATTDFINFIMSQEGQKVVEENKFIAVDATGAYTSNGASGKVVVAGSSSVSPVMEKLKEAYEAVNTNVTIEIQTSDSTTGMNAAMEGTCDIGMASRDLKDSEKEALTGTAIAIDGIGVIVNKDSSVDNLTKEEVKNIFTGQTTEWTK